MLLAFERGAALIVSVGAHFNLEEFLGKNRAGMSSTFLTRLRIGETLVDAKGVSRLYRPRSRARTWPCSRWLPRDPDRGRRDQRARARQPRRARLAEDQGALRAQDLASAPVGYSARYHAFSIIAIFTALAIGIVIGAGFGQDLVSDASEDLEQSLSSDLEEASARGDELAAELDRERAFGIRLYPPLVDGRLEGESIGVIALGDLPEDLAREIERDDRADRRRAGEGRGGPRAARRRRRSATRSAVSSRTCRRAPPRSVSAACSARSWSRAGGCVDRVARPAPRPLQRQSWRGRQRDPRRRRPPRSVTEDDQAAIEGFEEAILEGVGGAPGAGGRGRALDLGALVRDALRRPRRSPPWTAST